MAVRRDSRSLLLAVLYQNFKLGHCPTLVLLDNRSRFDFDASVARETRDLDSCARRRIALEVPPIEFVHGIVIRHIREEYCRLKNVLGAAAGSFQYGGEVPKDLLGLLF